MAEVIVKDSLGSEVAVKFTVTLHETVMKGDEGEPRWVLIVGTTHLDSVGASIPPVVVNNVTQGSLDKEIEEAVNSMCSLIDWGRLEVDATAPIVISYEPTGDNVSLYNSSVSIRIKDELPSSGLDFSNLKVTFNNGTLDFDVTNDVRIYEGPFEYVLKWVPDRLIADTYHD